MPGVAQMKMVAEYLDRAHHFEHLAAITQDPELKAQLAEQAEAYRKLALKRAAAMGVPIPSSSDDSNSGNTPRAGTT